MEETYADIVVGAEYTVDCGLGWVGRFKIVEDFPEDFRFEIEILEGIDDLNEREKDDDDPDEPGHFFIYYESRFQEAMQIIEGEPVEIQFSIKDLFDGE